MWGGDKGNCNGDNQKDVFIFNAGDNVDKIMDFEKGLDKLEIYGYTSAQAQYISVGNDTFVKLPNGDGILLKNICVADAPSANLLLPSTQ